MSGLADSDSTGPAVYHSNSWSTRPSESSIKPSSDIDRLEITNPMVVPSGYGGESGSPDLSARSNERESSEGKPVADPAVSTGDVSDASSYPVFRHSQPNRLRATMLFATEGAPHPPQEWCQIPAVTIRPTILDGRATQGGLSRRAREPHANNDEVSDAHKRLREHELHVGQAVCRGYQSLAGRVTDYLRLDLKRERHRAA